MLRVARAVLGLGLVALAVWLTACGADTETITIAAASDLAPLLNAESAALSAACGAAITPVLGSSGQLKEQILAGAAFDLFLSADRAYVTELDAAGRVTTAATLAEGQLALAWRAGSAIRTLQDVAATKGARIAIANPAHAPYGRAAKEALQAAGAWDAIQDRLVLGESVRQVADYVRSGNVEAAIVAYSLVIGTDTPFVLLKDAGNQPIIQSGAAIKGRNETGARCVLRWLRELAGKAALERFGFLPSAAP